MTTKKATKKATKKTTKKNIGNKITILRSDFINAIKSFNDLVNKTPSTMEITKSFLFNIEGKRCTLQATNLHIDALFTLDLKDKPSFQGKFAIDSKIFATLILETNFDYFDIVISETGDTHIKNDVIDYQLKTYPVNDIPEARFGNFVFDDAVKFNPHLWDDCFDVLPFTVREEIRAMAEVVWIDDKNFVATEGHFLAFKPHNYSLTDKFDKGFGIHRDFLKLIGKGVGNMLIDNNGLILVEKDNIQYLTNLPNIQYPDYRKVIPKKMINVLTDFPAEQILEITKLYKKLDKKIEYVKLEVKDNFLFIRYLNKFKQKIPINAKENFIFYTGVNLFQTVLSSLVGKFSIMKMQKNDNNRFLPAMWENGRMEILLMPIRVEEDK